MSAKALIYHMTISGGNTFPWVPTFYPVILTLEFEIFKYFNLANDFLTVSTSKSFDIWYFTPLDYF